ncbi:MAG: adenosine-specific kinase [bacterium]
MDYKISIVGMEYPEGINIIFGMSHFIKTVEDLYEALVSSVPGIQFGVAFCEASGPCLIRADGTNDELRALAIANAEAVGAGHTFLIVLRDTFPINVLPRVKACPEVCRIFCATANPVQVVIAESSQGRGVLGVIDGAAPKGVEGEDDALQRHEFLRQIGYKR